MIPRLYPPSLSSTGFSTFPTQPPNASFPVPHDPEVASSFASHSETAVALSLSFGMSDRSDLSSSLTNTIDGFGWTGFLQHASAQTTSSTIPTNDSSDNDGTRIYSDLSATGPFYSWCFLQLCGVAIDVGTSLAEVLPISVDQAFSLSHVLRRRSLDPADRATLVQRSTLFLHGLYRTPSSSMPTPRAQMVYVCAVAMTFLFQPELRDQRMMREFQRRIGDFRPLLGLHDTVGAADPSTVGHGLLSHGL